MATLSPVGFRKSHAALIPCWRSLKQRCFNPRDKDYKYYGGRGITVCARWCDGEHGKSGFQCFVEDMGPKPSAAHSIDRIDSNGNYESGNCRWATASEQNRNRRKFHSATSRFVGVLWHTNHRRWVARLHLTSGRIKHLGSFTNEEDAARAYDDAARYAFGSDAKLNFPREAG